MIGVGEVAPEVDGVAFGDGPVALLFYKDTCPVCQMAAPTTARFEAAYPGRLVGIAQDPPDRVERFAREYGFAARSVTDPPPYPASDAYGITSVPTLVLVGRDGRVEDVSGAWDRAAWNRISERIAADLGVAASVVSEDGDGRPPFKPG
ncbi:MAG: TlpA family protein disulfide reductase [Actinomycetota bacterium]